MPPTSQTKPKNAPSSAAKKKAGAEGTSKGWNFFGFKAPKVKKTPEADFNPATDQEEPSTSSGHDKVVGAKPEPPGSPGSTAAVPDDDQVHTKSDDTPTEKVMVARDQITVPLPTPLPLKISTPVRKTDRSTNRKTDLLEGNSKPIQVGPYEKPQEPEITNGAFMPPAPKATAEAITMMPAVFSAGIQPDAQKKRGNGRAAGVTDGRAAAAGSKPSVPEITEQDQAVPGTEALPDGEAVAEYVKNLCAEADQLLPQEKGKKKKEKAEAPLMERLQKSWGGLSYMERLEKVVQAKDDKEAGAAPDVTAQPESSDVGADNSSGQIAQAMEQLSIQGQDASAPSPFAFQFNAGPQGSSPGPTPAVGKFRSRQGKAGVDAASAAKSTKKARVTPPLGLGADTQVTAIEEEGVAVTPNRKHRKSGTGEASSEHTSLTDNTVAPEARTLVMDVENAAKPSASQRSASTNPRSKSAARPSTNKTAVPVTGTDLTAAPKSSSVREQAGGKLRERQGSLMRNRAVAPAEKRSAANAPAAGSEFQSTDQESQNMQAPASARRPKSAAVPFSVVVDDKQQANRLQAQLDTKIEELGRAQTRNAQLEQQLKEVQDQARKLQQDLAGQQKKSLQVERDLAAVKAESNRKDIALQKVHVEKDGLQKQVESLQTELKGAKKQAFEATKQRDVMEKKLNEFTSRFSQVGAAVHQMNQQLETFKAGNDSA